MKSQQDKMGNIYRIKEFLKRYPNLYKVLLNTFSPVCPFFKSYRVLVEKLPNSAKIINIGSGTFRLSEKIINIDNYPYRNVDIVASAESLPFKTQSCEGAISIVLMEHLRWPHKHIKEMFRVLKPEGLVYAVAPFIVGYHSAPSDYNRWTEDGIKEAFSNDFEILEVGIAGGPTSGFLWIFQEWLALLLSFNIKILYEFLVILIMFLTFPMKFIDLLLSRYRFAKNIASSFYILAKKRRVEYED